jgi:hypothetical protein
LLFILRPIRMSYSHYNLQIEAQIEAQTDWILFTFFFRKIFSRRTCCTIITGLWGRRCWGWVSGGVLCRGGSVWLVLCCVGVLPLKFMFFSMLAFCFGLVNSCAMLYFLLILWTN